ncbi:MAG TPA: transglutaminase domain-containing protein [Thermoplasmatales archaeon]|nr:transglutaminase domain-containing protein [Thermoplasmatales archaeon]
MGEEKKVSRGNLLIVLIIAGIFALGVLGYILLVESIHEENKPQNIPLLQQLRKEVTEELKEFKLHKILKHRDLVLRRENFTQISRYQKYVTPNDPVVLDYISTHHITSIEDAYYRAVSWVWVSDQTLHGKPELWLLPAVFIRDTPSYPTNPVPGNIVSDCESQAYTLVSILEAVGVPKEDVRVVVGEVNFSGEKGGHAWVQIYKNGDWVELEATSGPFWDDDNHKLVNNKGFPFNFFETHPYPVEEYWAFFNDKYYHNPHNGKQSPGLPPHWLTQ